MCFTFGSIELCDELKRENNRKKKWIVNSRFIALLSVTFIQMENFWRILHYNKIFKWFFCVIWVCVFCLTEENIYIIHQIRKQCNIDPKITMYTQTGVVSAQCCVRTLLPIFNNTVSSAELGIYMPFDNKTFAQSSIGFV